MESKGRVRRFLTLDVAAIEPWARRRFGGGESTIQLLRAAAGDDARQVVACVALLDLSEDALRACGGGDPDLAARLLRHRARLLEGLEARGVFVPVPDAG